MRIIKKLLLVFFILLIGIAGFYFGARTTQTQGKIASPIISNGLDSLYTFEILGERYDILFEKERILFQVFESTGKNGFIPFTFTNHDYPKLFEQGSANSSFHTVTIVSANNKPMIEVANNYHDHGGFTPAYTLIIDPTSGKATVKE
jgi:hypothetical protein